MKKSKYVDLEKKKIVGKKELYSFKLKSKPDKKSSVNKSKPKTTSLDQQISSLLIT